MATTIFILILLAGFHFVYESILLPDLIVKLRYRIFKNRDRLIQLKAKRKDELDNNIFNAVYTSTNVVIQFLPDINLSMLLNTKRNSSDLSNCNANCDVELIMNQLHTSSDSELRAIHIENLEIAKMALIYNMGAFIILVSPFFLMGWLAIKILSPLRQPHFYALLKNITLIIIVLQNVNKGKLAFRSGLNILVCKQFQQSL